MEQHLLALEERIHMAAELCHRLRVENNQLRQEMAQLHNEKKRLDEKIQDAKTRLQGLLAQIPE